MGIGPRFLAVVLLDSNPPPSVRSESPFYPCNLCVPREADWRGGLKLSKTTSNNHGPLPKYFLPGFSSLPFLCYNKKKFFAKRKAEVLVYAYFLLHSSSIQIMPNFLQI
jgi:hypothetical protein